MPNISLPFTLNEYQSRLQKTRQAMARSGIEVLFLCDPSNMAWLTGYDGWSFYVHQGILVGPSGDPVFWGRSMDAKGALRTSYMKQEDIIGYDDDYVMSNSKHAMEHLVQVICDHGWQKLVLGVEMENYYFSARAYEVLSQEFGEQIIDATGLVNWQRAVKSETELSYMYRAAKIVEIMHERILETFQPGIRKCDVVAEIYDAALRGSEDENGRFGGDYPAFVPLLPTGKDATAAHLTWDDRILENGAGTFFEIAGCYRRYHAPLCRTIFLGTPPSDMLAAEDAILEGIDDGIAASRPGSTAGDVARAFYKVLEKRGIQRKGRCGYPVGLSYPPDWGERTFSIRTSDETVLEPNMTFHFMPALWMEDWGLEITETLRIRNEGAAECMVDYPRKLFIKD